MVSHPFERFCNCVRESLDNVWVGICKGMRRKICGIWDLSAFRTDAGKDISLPICFHFRCGGLKQRHIVAVAAGESAGHHIKLHSRIDRCVCSGDHTVLAHYIFKRHFRNAAGSAADDGLSFQLIPGERNILASDQERTVTFRHLRKDHGRIVFLLIQNIDAGFRTAKTDLGFTGQHTGHDLISAAAVDQFNFKSFLREKSFFQRDVLWGIKHGMCHLAECQLDSSLLCVIRFLPACGTQHDENYR